MVEEFILFLEVNFLGMCKFFMFDLKIMVGGLLCSIP